MDEIANGLKGLKPERLKYILISLTLLVALYPMIERGGLSSRILNLFFTMILVTTIYVTSSSSRRLTVSLCIGIPWLLAGWANTLFQNSVLFSFYSVTARYLRVNHAFYMIQPPVKINSSDQPHTRYLD